MLYKGYKINPKIARELDEILASGIKGNSPNSNDNRKDGNR